MQIIELTNTCAASSHDSQKKEYVFYTGGIAGITDITNLESKLESHPETLQSSPDKIELNRD